MSALAESAALSDLAVSRLRTIVPILWGSLVATLLRLVSPHLPGDVGQALVDWLGSELALTAVTAAVIAAWYWVWRRLEPRIPDWLARLALGSARAPGYALTEAPVIDGAHVVTTLTDAERADLTSLRDILDPGDPGRDALDRITS